MGTEIRKRVRHFNLPGNAHELTFSCYHRLPLLSRDRTRLWMIESIESARQNRQFALWAFVLMPEHVHLIVHPQKFGYDVAWFLKSIKQPVSRKAHAWLAENDSPWLDRLTFVQNDGRRIFRFWQAGPGYDRNIDHPDPLRTMIEYIHNNPVRRGLVLKAADWEWSSASWYEKGECILSKDSLP